MIVYKIKHAPTGRFYKPAEHPDQSCLSRTGKIYHKVPNMRKFPAVTRLGRYTITLLPCDWELVRCSIIELDESITEQIEIEVV